MRTEESKVTERCVHCGYSLFGLSPVSTNVVEVHADANHVPTADQVQCPECGKFGTPGEWARRSALSRLVWYGFLIALPLFVWSVLMCCVMYIEAKEVRKHGFPTNSEAIGDALATLGGPLAILATVVAIVCGIQMLWSVLPTPQRLRIALVVIAGASVGIASVWALPELCGLLGLF